MHKDFGFDDDYVIKTLVQSMEELRKHKLDQPPPAEPNELPRKPFGIFTEPNFEAKVISNIEKQNSKLFIFEPTNKKQVGIRKSTFTDTEKEVTDNVIMRQEISAQELAESNLSDEATGGSNSQINAGLLKFHFVFFSSFACM